MAATPTPTPPYLPAFDTDALFLALGHETAMRSILDGPLFVRATHEYEKNDVRKHKIAYIRSLLAGPIGPQTTLTMLLFFFHADRKVLDAIDEKEWTAIGVTPQLREQCQNSSWIIRKRYWRQCYEAAALAVCK